MLDAPDAPDAIADRFPTAATSSPPTTEQRDAVATLQQGARGLAEIIVWLVPEGRNREIALESLENVLMRANRGVFVDSL